MLPKEDRIKMLECGTLPLDQLSDKKSNKI